MPYRQMRCQSMLHSQPSSVTDRRASAFWTLGDRRGSLHEERLPKVPQGMCLIRTLYSAISPGTERLVFDGRVPQRLKEDMRVPYMDGGFPFPVKYGYSLVGRVVAGSHPWLNKTVHVMHPHQDLCLVRKDDLFEVPDGLPPARATLASNLETAVNALWDAHVQIGDASLVVGFGVIGSLVARLLAMMPEGHVEVYDTDAHKRALAHQLGFRLFDPARSARKFDLAFHTTGTAEGLQGALDHVGFEGRVVELSWYGTQPVNVHLGGSFHTERKTIISSQVSNVAAPQRSRWDCRRRKEFVFQLLSNPVFDHHVSHTVSFAELPEFFPRLAESPASYLSVLVTYNGRHDV